MECDALHVKTFVTGLYIMMLIWLTFTRVTTEFASAEDKNVEISHYSRSRQAATEITTSMYPRLGPTTTADVPITQTDRNINKVGDTQTRPCPRARDATL